MLQRRPSKRFVLAESGQDSSWDASTDNDPNINATINVENLSDLYKNLIMEMRFIVERAKIYYA